MSMYSAKAAQRWFFAGKGGVGKTTMAAAAALFSARQGARTLLVTTDPAAHIGRVLQCEVGDWPTAVAEVPDLDAARIDPQVASAQYKAEVLAQANSQRYDQTTLGRMEEELNSPCTEEIAVFRRFLDHLLTTAYDTVVFDTAPTGHTLRLLELPLSYSRQIEAKARGGQALGAAEDHEAQRMRHALALMRDHSRTSFAFVVYPEATPIAEAARAARDLRNIGLVVSPIIVNQVLPKEVCVHPLFRQRRQMQEYYLGRISEQFPGAQVRWAHLQERDVIGVNALRLVADEVFGTPTAPADVC